MFLGYQSKFAFPFWRNLAVHGLLAIALLACADPSQEAIADGARAQQLLDTDNLPAARVAIAEAIASRDDIVDLHLLRGRIEAAADSRSGAYDAYSDALALDATNGEALLAVAQLGLSTGHLKESLEAAERISTLAPDQPDALLVRGIHAIIRHRYDQAIEFADRILIRTPENEGGVILKARALFASDKPEDALAVLNTIQGNANSRGVVLTRLEIYRAMRQGDQLAAEFSRLRRLGAGDISLRIDEANVSFKRGKRPLAHQLLQQALASPRTDAASARSAIGLWEEYGWHDIPSRTLNEIVAKGSVAARQALARFLIEHRNLSGAELVLQSLSADKGLTARFLLAKGRIAEAEGLADNVLESDETNCDALIAASEVELRNDRAEDASRIAQRAATECPQQPSAWLSAAKAYQATGPASGVDRTFVQALDANKQSTALTTAYVDWLVSVRKSREAIATARRLTRHAPSLLSGWRLYESLCRRLDGDCEDEARHGLANARTRFGIDLPPGASLPNGLFGRFAYR